MAIVAFGIFVSLACRRQWQWTPRAEGADSRRSAKTLWDWLQLLGIPVALAALAFLLNDAQAQRDQLREDQRAAREQLGKVNPDGVYDLALDEGWVSVGIGADTAQFAVSSIGSWWPPRSHAPPRRDDADDHR